MSGKIFLSVVIPVYNTPPSLLSRTIHSLVSDRPMSTELIFVDDGSITETAEFLDSAVSTIENAFVIHQANAGQNAARERGVFHAHGEYIAFCDSDDEVIWRKFGVTFQDLLSTNADIIAFNCVVVDDVTGEKKPYGFSRDVFKSDGGERKRLLLSQCAEVWRHIFRKTLLTSDIFCKDSRIGEDLAVVFLALVKAESVLVIDAYPYYYHVSDSGVERAIACERRTNIINVFSFIRSHLSEDAFIQYRYELEWQAIWHVQFFETLSILQSRSSRSEKKRYISMLCSWIDEEYPKWRNNPYLRMKKQAEDVRFRLIIERHFSLYSFLRQLRIILNMGLRQRNKQ